MRRNATPSRSYSTTVLDIGNTFNAGRSRRICPHSSIPPSISNISSQSREKGHLLRFSELPKPLIDAVISAEDKRFFDHWGVDMARIIKAAYVDTTRARQKPN